MRGYGLVRGRSSKCQPIVTKSYVVPGYMRGIMRPVAILIYSRRRDIVVTTP